MALLAGVMVVFLSRFMQKKWVLLVTAPVLVLYTLFVGGSPSVIRSAVMSILAFGGYLVGRKGAGMTALLLTAAVMCLLNPQVISDAGFQLSFAATFGLLLFAGPLQQGAQNLLSRFLPAEKAAKVASPLSAYLLFTLAAQVTTLPVIALHFKRISLSSLFANPLILPAQPFLLGFGGLSAILGVIHPLTGKISALLAWPLLAFTNRVVELLGKLKWGSLTLHPGMAPWLLGFLIAFILLFVFRDFFKKKFDKGFAWLVFALILACVSIWSIALHQPDGRLHVQVMRAGDETALFVRAPGGEALLFDPGGEVNEVSAAVTRELSPWNFHLDDVWLTDPTKGSTLQLLDERITINRVLLSPLVYTLSSDQPGLVLLAGMTSCELSIGEVVIYKEGFKVQLLTADLEHTAVYMSFGDTTILVPNGVDFARIREVAPHALAHPSVLVLAETDISYIPPRVWDQAGAAIVLWNSAVPSPREDWIGTGNNPSVELVSDGVNFGLTGQ
jgi:competence protein ComEC